MASAVEDLAVELARLVGDDNVLTDPADRWAYGYDNSRKHTEPDVVAFATSLEQVRETVRLCNRYEKWIRPIDSCAWNRE
jgi:D-lactate dehydrogenase